MSSRRTASSAAALGLATALIASVVAASPAQAADTAKPVLGGAVNFAPAAVDTTRGTATTTPTVQLADSSGVADATLTLTSPDGGTADVDLDLDPSSGTATNGTWIGSQSFGTWDATGRWTPTLLTATDNAGNTATFTSGLGAGVTVSRTADTTAPTLSSASSSTATADTTADPATVLVRVQAKDDLAGVAGGTVTFTSPDGNDTALGYLSGDPVQGSANDGSWNVPVSFPVRSAPGVWRLTGVDVSDAQNNVRSYGLADAQLPSLSVTVTSADDADAPALTSFSVGPATRSTAYGADGMVYAQVGFSDATSGVADVQITLQRPSGVVDDSETQPVVLADTTMKTGTSRSGTVTVPIYVESFATGTWKVASVVVDDNAGNTTTLGTAQLPGSRTTFAVSSAAADTKLPAATGVAFSPTSVDARLDVAQGTVLVAANDPDTVPSGVAGGTVTLTSPSGLETATASFTGNDLAAGDPANGTFAASYTLPRNSEDGAWTVTSVTVTDGANHTATQSNWSTAPTLTVLGKGRAPATPPGAPAIGTATLSGTTATVTWTAPTDNGGAQIKRYRVNAVQGGTVVGTVTTTGSPTTVPNLRRGQSYVFTVAAENAAGVGSASASSNTVTVAPALAGPPTIGRAELQETTATVAWTPPTDDGGAAVTGYVVTPFLGSTPQSPTSVTNTTSATVGGLSRGRTYTFRVAAVNSVGTGSPSQSSNSVSVAATVPAAPQVTSASATGNTVTVRWSAPDDGGAAITGYQVTGSPAGTCSATTTSCTVTGLTQDQAYSFTVVARNAVGPGSASAPSDQVVAGAPQQPTSLSVANLPSSILYGISLGVSGKLTASGVGLGGQSVQLQVRRVGTSDAWTTWARTNSGSDGSVRFAAFRPPQSLSIRLLAQPTAPYVASTSVTRTVNVKRQVTIGSNRGSAKRNSTITLAGRATPARSGDLVTLQRWSRGAWRAVAHQRLTSYGYRFRVKMTKRGTYSFRVVAVGTGFVPSSSPARALRIK